jgi:endoribonuclease Dicer
MDMFCGEMNTDSYNRKMWEGHFSKNMVIVCTAEILRQCLLHAFITMDRINLLIFDEAHHAKKDHPYARIIKDFYYQKNSTVQLPKIFGMTASPVDAKTDVKKAAMELETILHCKIATAYDESLEKFRITKEQESLAKYSALGNEFETPLFKQMLERFNTNAVFRKPLLFSRSASKDLGSWCSDQVWTFCLNDDETKKLLGKTERQYNAKKVQEPLEVLEKRKVLLQEARDIVKSHVFEAPDFDPYTTTSSNLSSKVVLLIHHLRERFERPTEDKAIVFVQQRYTARLLAHLFSHPNIGTLHLKVGTLVSIFDLCGLPSLQFLRS